MSRSMLNKQQPAGQGPGQTSRPTTGARSIRSASLFLLVFVDFIVALMMVVSFAGFIINPDSAVKAGPMYVTFALTTGAAMLMFVLALNASFFPFISRAHVPNISLVMWAMAATGIVTGLLTVGGLVSPIVTRLVLGSIAFMFITVQNTRLAQAREAAPAGQAQPSAPQAQARPGSRQRRGGRKR